MPAPGQICGGELIWVARTLRRATAHIQGMQHISQAPGAWKPDLSWSFTGRRAEISSPCFPKEEQASQGIGTCLWGFAPSSPELSLRNLSKRWSASVRHLSNHHHPSKEKDVKSTMLKIVKASPPQSRKVVEESQNDDGLVQSDFVPHDVQLACSFSPQSPACLSAQTAAVEGLNSKARGQRRLLPADLCSFLWRRWKVCNS